MIGDNVIGCSWPELESKSDTFVVEALAAELKPEWIEQALRQTQRESIRERSLPASFTLWLIVLLGLFRRVSYDNLLEKLVGTWWAERFWPDDQRPTSSAVTRARDRLGAEPVKVLWQHSAREWSSASLAGRFHGKRVYALDGSTFKTSDTPANDTAFGRPGAARGRAGYPQMRGVLLVDLGARIVVAEKHGAFKKSEIELAREVARELKSGDLALFDRNFYALDLLHDLRAKRCDFVVRIKKNIRMRILQKLGIGDWLVEVDVPWKARDKRPDLPRVMRFRLIEYTPAGGTEKIRVLTSLLDAAQFKADEVANLYHSRWGVETVIDEIKTHLCGCQTVDRAVVFRSQTPARIEQEWYGLLCCWRTTRCAG
jgi:hypothetical protein